MSSAESGPLVRVEGLSVAYRSGGADVTVARDVSFEAAAGRTVAVVGESGSGKSTVAGALLGHLRHGSRVTGGRVVVDGKDVLSLDARGLRELRTRDIAMVGQNAGHALTPSMRVGTQIEESLLAQGMTRAQRRERVRSLVEKVGLPDPEGIARRYPHQLSGGQQQRVAIAMALAARPKVLVLDEPTTALDVVTQARILDLVAGLGEEFGLTSILVSHDLGVVARMADQVVVMREGEVVEAAAAAELFDAPRHPYTRRLLASVPRISDRGLAEVADDGTRTVRERVPVPDDAPEVVSLRDVTIDYGAHRAVAGVSLGLRRGEVLALVGESGSGKSTLAWSLAGLRAPSSGTMRLLGTGGEGGKGSGGEGEGDLTVRARKRPPGVRRRVQLVFQNADTSLNPRRIVREAVRRPLRFFGLAERGGADERARELLADVALDPALSDRLPGQLSGGQRQRVGIARALAGDPHVVVADEVTTALDVSVQASVLALLDDLRTERDLAFVFISHDLAVVRGIADRVAVMRDGLVVEEGPVEAVFTGPNHPYTRRLLDAVLEPRPVGDGGEAGATAGASAPTGDTAVPEDRATVPDPEWIDLGGGHRIRCWHTDGSGRRS
ncbi:peptide/nickel transport system ATP-binding protein [Nocardiopsis sp. Huas11]|uniref:dipeptide ABC transporter ATP-binding protein n=1 Tax=Nocardiopsis sp. Huas11 TaxID=2183912 RepID=UPI000EB4DBA8|nr:ABC transporter ATP-binding protein [Nocardiopsis sp. Huas11]RKS06071.1 peptide/nickel transport system ATP-binding protein [Nocardiopsis sp. Huas11]